ncbi:MAG: type II secretion system F family protein [Magnetococcales bacterium]|nr:type II secretion system F family protein [Magnetococcales bacterium]
MTVFRYQGMRGGGKKVKGVVNADSDRDARHLLRQQGIFPTLLERETPASAKEHKGWQPLVRRYRPPIRERIVLTRQLATLLAAGFPMIEALATVEQQIHDAPLRTVVAGIRNAVSEGQSLSAALGQHAHIFPPLYLSLVRAGEQGGGGALEGVLARLATVMEEERRLRARLQSAMIYPTVMAVVGGIILIFLVAVVIPKVTVLFRESRQVLPLATRSLLAISDFVREWGVLAAIGGVAAMLLVSWSTRSTPRRLRIERLVWRVPVFAGVLSRLVTLRVCQLLGLLSRSGVPVVTSLQVTADATGFSYARTRLLEAARAVEQGESLATAMEQTGCLQELALRMIRAGEQAGNLESMLDRAAQLYQEEIEQTIERLMHLVEPTIILVMGGVVGYVVVAVLLPIFEMNQLIR